MNKMKFFPFRLALLLLISFSASSYLTAPEKLNFGVYHGSKKIGSLYIHRNTDGKRVNYTLHSEVTITLLMDFKIVENISDLFEDGNLKTSYHTRHVNNMLKAKNTASRGATAYVLTKDGKHDKYVKEWITETVATLYFREPKENARIYSQNHQQILVIKKSATNAYRLDLPDGNNTTFEYLNGKLRTVVSNTTLGSVKFVREN